MDRSRIAFLVPAYNEAKTIHIVIERLVSHGIVFVADDNSTDDTAKIAKEWGASIVTNITNRGYENNLTCAFKEIVSLNSFEYIITLDADGQHDTKYIADFISIIRNQSPDLIIENFNSKKTFKTYVRNSTCTSYLDV